MNEKNTGNSLRAIPGSRKLARRSKAICLPEIVMSLMIVPILLLGLASVTYVPIRIMRHAEDVSVAQDRAEMVFSILSAPLEHCGYGLPKKPGDYARAFGNLLPPFTWPGSLSIETSVVLNRLRENSACRIAYAVETNSRTTARTETTSDDARIAVNSVPPLLKSTSENGGEVSNWLLFGSMTPYSLPARKNMEQTTLPDGDVSISVSFNRPLSDDEKLTIPENDELFYFRVMECQVRNSSGNMIFATRDHMGTGWQPRVEGVVDVRFELDANRRLLHVWTLTHGTRRYSNVVTEGTPAGWPEKYARDIPREYRHYRLLAREAVFLLPNL